MDDPRHIKTSWKERLLGSWHQPWYLRQGSSNTNTPRDPIASSRFGQRRPRRAISTTRSSETQSKCIFLAKLPGEIRNVIYMLVLGDRCLAIYDSGIGPWKSRVRHLEVPPKQMGFTDPLLSLPTNKLAILQTCRQVYVEAADLLYSTNHFQVLRMQDMKYFYQFMISISPTRLATITNLTLVINVEYFEPLHSLASNMFRHWKRLWTVICMHMSALRHLTLSLQNIWAIENLKLTPDTYWVKPFLRLRNLKKFDLVVNPANSIAPEGLQDRPGSDHAEQLISKIDRLQQYSEKLLCSPR
ncbi:MAG: hypothetical protein Q9216_004142 [Gyalolechia sp. 2 TL-2023]